MEEKFAAIEQAYECNFGDLPINDGSEIGKVCEYPPGTAVTRLIKQFSFRHGRRPQFEKALRVTQMLDNGHKEYVVKIVDSAFADDQFGYIVYEHFPTGCTLGEFTERCAAMVARGHLWSDTELAVLRLTVKQLLEAVLDLQRLGIAHQNLNGHTVLFDRDPLGDDGKNFQLKLAGFENASVGQFAQRNPEWQDIKVGCPAYLAPECWHSDFVEKDVTVVMSGIEVMDSAFRHCLGVPNGPIYDPSMVNAWGAGCILHMLVAAFCGLPQCYPPFCYTDESGRYITRHGTTLIAPPQGINRTTTVNEFNVHNCTDDGMITEALSSQFKNQVVKGGTFNPDIMMRVYSLTRHKETRDWVWEFDMYEALIRGSLTFYPRMRLSVQQMETNFREYFKVQL